MEKKEGLLNIKESKYKNAVKFFGQSNLKCPGLDWKRESGDGEIDKEVIPLLTELNKLSFLHTTGSCAGHSLKEIDKYHKAWGIREPYRITIALHVKNEAVQSFIKIVREFHDIADSRLWCELGYQDDLNNQTEVEFIPFQIVIHAETKNRRDKYLKKLSTFITNLKK